MPGFLPDDQLRNPQADEPWKKSERDWVLDTYLSGKEGASPKLMAVKLGRNPKAIKRLIEQFTNNERDRVIRYEPFRRVSRKGKKFTQNELFVWRALVEKKVGVEYIARLLQRDVGEMEKRLIGEKDQIKSRTEVAPTLDLIWALRYAHFVYKKDLVSDEAYNALVEEEIEYGGGEPAFKRIKNYQGWPNHIRSLALYLEDRQKFML